MRWSRLLAGAALFWLTTALGVVAASLFVSNDLFTGPYARAVSISALLFVLSFLFLVAAGRPNRSWKRTTYW